MDLRPDPKPDGGGEASRQPPSEGAQRVVGRAALGLAEAWVRRALAAPPLLFAACFLTVAWWEAQSAVDITARSLRATETAAASQQELYWAIVPGRDHRAEPMSPDDPRHPRLRLTLALAFETDDGRQGRLRLQGPDRGNWATETYFLRPLRHVGDAATLALPLKLRIDPGYRQALSGARPGHGRFSDAANHLEAVERAIDRPLEILAFTWWLAEPREVTVHYQPSDPQRAVLASQRSGHLGALLLAATGASLVVVIGLSFLGWACRLLAYDLPPWMVAAGALAIVVAVPWWSPQISRFLPWLGSTDEPTVERLLSVLGPEPTPERIALGPPTQAAELEVIEWDLPRSRDADLLAFLRLERGNRRFASVEQAYAALLDDITARIVTAPSSELATFMLRARELCGPDRAPLDEALMEGAHLVAQDAARPEEIRTLAADLVRELGRRLSYTYYELASAERRARLEPFRRHPDPYVADQVRRQIDMLREHGGRGY
jgi:hypothetical protein